ncbi:hypothetical protein [Actinopolymorpha cephalotaxi]|uniref:PH domain-containing protein n=1 Tax=Actinopolymorpha cephalotaxi TaxID=504797 RepID=A0ABX2S5G7_9ACTN|nr:hypothetical protein [Actinopolymorpha cephalotaxi]NYH84283.1 hypothetical protein [Actinopolymorpha cephalotaxi]
MTVAVGSVGFCAAVILRVLGGPLAPAVILGVCGLAAMAVGIHVHRIWRDPYHLKLSPAGIDLQYRGHRIHLPWNDIDRWDVGNTSATSPRYGRDVVMAWPAPSVAEPMAEPRGVLWRRDLSCWQVCEPALTDGSTAEVVAAFETFAPDKRPRP